MQLRIFTTILFICFWSQLSGQYNNPFEIKSRLDSVYSDENINIESVSNQDTTTEVTPDLIAENEVIARELANNNPFEVDHVPYRKSELKETSVVESRKSDSSDKPVEAPGNLIIFIISIVSLILIAIVANTRRSLFSKLLKSFSNDNILKLTQREENGGLNGAFIILYIVFFINAASLAYLFLSSREISVNNIWIILLVGIFGVYLIRHLFLYLFSVIFPVTREVRQFSFLIAVFNLLMGLVLIPLNLIIAYAPDAMSVATLYMALGVVAFVYIIRCLRGMLIGILNFGDHLFHFFLYLCTFEIVPILLVFRLFKDLSTIS